MGNGEKDDELVENGGVSELVLPGDVAVSELRKDVDDRGLLWNGTEEDFVVGEPELREEKVKKVRRRSNK